MAADNDGLNPSRDGPRDALEDDWLAENGATEDVADLRGEVKKPALDGK